MLIFGRVWDGKVHQPIVITNKQKMAKKKDLKALKYNKERIKWVC